MNIIDIVIAVLLVMGLVKSLGRPWKSVQALLVAAIFLMVFGVAARMSLDLPLPDPFKETIKHSYFVQLSLVMIRTTYPAVEEHTPKVGSFIKEKIIAEPAPPVTLPPATLPNKIEPNKLLESLDKAVKQK